jgi:hypothetical protein
MLGFLRIWSNFLVIGALVACSSTTVIRSSDPEAKIYADGQLLGTGQATYSDTKIVGSTTQVSLQKEGCQTRNYVLSRSESFDVGACIGGVFVYAPFLWIMGYNGQHNYDFNCETIAK